MNTGAPLRPNITAAQITGLLIMGIPALAQLLHVFGVYDLTLVQQQALEDTLKWVAAVAAVLFVSDAGLRAARNHADAQKALVDHSYGKAGVQRPAVPRGKKV